MDNLKQARTWAEISLNNLENNYHILRKMIPANCRFAGVVKANAYGHGAKEVGKKLQDLGADMLAVACLSEAIELREAGITIPILCLGQTPVEYGKYLLEYNIIQTVSDLKAAYALSDTACSANKTMSVHIKLDTGMTRLGFQWSDQSKQQTIESIMQVFNLPGLHVDGMFTHFANADGNENYTKMQMNRFLEAKRQSTQQGAHFSICHCAASSAILRYPCSHLDMVRAGIAMYGYPGVKNDCGLLPVMTLKSRIAAVRDVPAGTFVSYGCTFRLSRDSRLAVLPIGYADGYRRAFSNGMEVLIKERRCPIVGRVCMDMCMVDITDIGEVAVGDIAVIYGKEGLAEEGAKRAGTIVYELLTGIAPRVPRIYVDNKPTYL